MIYPKLSDGTIDWCVMCKHEGRALFDGCCECEYPENSDGPPTKYEQKPMTNGDRIRSMSDEELAVQIADWVSGDCPSIDFCPKPRNDVTHKVECMPWKCWLDWLEQEAK